MIHRSLSRFAFLGALAALAVFVAAADGPPPYPAPELARGALTGAELRVMDLALESILLARGDLGFKKDYVEDPFRLPAVQRALEDPLSLVEWTYGWDAVLLDSPPLAEIIERAGAELVGEELLDLSSRPPERQEPTPDAAGPEGLSAEVWRTIARLDRAAAAAAARLDERVWSALSPEDIDYLRTYLVCRFAREVEEEPAGLDCPEEEAYGADPRFLGLMENFPLAELLGAARDLAAAAEEAAAALAAEGAVLAPPAPLALPGRSGRIVVGTRGNDLWEMGPEGPAAILIDPAGDDVYVGPFGAAGGLVGEKLPPVCVLIDLGGSDAYLARGRAQGSGALGIAIQFDLAGDDTYRAGKLSQGAGVFGAGLLVDREGDDLYEADLLVQGAGAIGLGLLWDEAGRDSYRGAFYAQGFGYPRGFGLLSDRDGYDSYYAGGRYDAWPTWGPYMISCSQGYAFGLRPVASGGIGILHDRNGKDVYQAEVFSQGGSYWYGLGALIDDAEKDQYVAQVYSQGAGVHLSTGILLDRGGNDNYVCDHQAQGFAHDFSVGWLIDEAGNDNYSGKTNAQGCAVTNSVAGLIDRAGDDGYLSWEHDKGQGYGGTARGFGNIGLQIDMQGKDTYSLDRAGDGAWWTLQSWYAGIDVPEEWWAVEKDGEGKEIARTLALPAELSEEVKP